MIETKNTHAFCSHLLIHMYEDGSRGYFCHNKLSDKFGNIFYGQMLDEPGCEVFEKCEKDVRSEMRGEK